MFLNPLDVIKSASYNNNIVNTERTAIGYVLNWVRLVRNRFSSNNANNFGYKIYVDGRSSQKSRIKKSVTQFFYWSNNFYWCYKYSILLNNICK